MSTMVERVAWDIKTAYIENKEPAINWEAMARAAIAAMREPEPHMVEMAYE